MEPKRCSEKPSHLSCAGAANTPEACAAIKIADLPVEIIGNQPLVEVKMDGRPVRLLFDTGAEGTLMTEDAVQRLELATDPDVTTMVHGVGGVSAHRNAMIGRLSLGGESITDHRLAVVKMPAEPTRKWEGLLGRDIISKYDLDVNFPAKRLALYKARDCSDMPAILSSSAERLPPSSKGRALAANTISAEVNGVKINAEFDTGAGRSTIDPGRLAEMGVSADMLAKDRTTQVQGATARRINAQLHVFDTLRVGSITTKRPLMTVTPLPRRSVKPELDMLIGMDFLTRHRVWISFAGHAAFVEK
jgi:predicted aspartyl protease